VEKLYQPCTGYVPHICKFQYNYNESFSDKKIEGRNFVPPFLDHVSGANAI